jgi:hypothetical protein
MKVLYVSECPKCQRRVQLKGWVHAIRPPQLAASFATDPFLHSSIVNPRASS